MQYKFKILISSALENIFQLQDIVLMQLLVKMLETYYNLLNYLLID